MTESVSSHNDAESAPPIQAPAVCRGDAQAAISRLRHDIARLEGRLAEEVRLELAPAGNEVAQNPGQGPGQGPGQNAGPGRDDSSGSVPLGVRRLDAMLGGGLRLAELHEVRAAETRDGASAAGFVIAMMARLGVAGQSVESLGVAGQAPAIVWISEADRRREAGELYPPGLMALGIDPGRIIRIAATRTADALWAFEAALACRGVAFAVCEVRRPARVLDLTATRRCALRAQASGATGFLLRLAETPEPTAAPTRFLIAPAPSVPSAGRAGLSAGAAGYGAGLGRPVWRVTLEKARSGRTGLIDLEWNADERCFAEPGNVGRYDADSVAVAAAAFDRPDGAGRQSAA